ncbi:T9SS type A sorting domain-containing protein [Winogradskyella sp.]|uniref:T9SS type A sorting domain-containing protein n=1 Tax=Winogradskyella sp. TaxID=1883156 RepID=UPI003BABC4AD
MKTLLLKKRHILLLILIAFCYNTRIYAQGASGVTSDGKQSFTIAFNSLDGSNVTRELQLSFSEMTSDGFDEGYEIKNLEVLADDLNLILDNELMLAQAYGPINEDKVVPLVLQSTGNYNFTIQLTAMENMGDQSIRLRDNFTGDYFDLRGYEAFEFASDEGVFLGRFEIFFKTATLSQTDFESENIAIRYVNNTNTIAISNPNNKDVKRIEIFNVSGKKVYGNNTMNNERFINYKVNHLLTGIYIIRLVADNNTALSKKVFIK